MWIRSWSIVDFGHLGNTHLDGLTEGVNVVVGPNEAGKTTTLHFLRWVLFGFPHARSQAMQRYRPGTTRIGGRVEVGHGCRTVNVQRHQGDDQPTLSAPDGSPLPRSLWSEVVGSAGRELFETVFAITTDELNGFASLNTDEVREHIYAAGLVGRGPSAREALTQLDSTRSSLLKRRSGLIRDIHRRLDERTEALHDATAASVGLAERRVDLDRLRALADDCDRRRRQVDTDAAHLAALGDSRPSWSEAKELRRRLAAMPAAVELPADPLSRLDSLITAIDVATAELDDAEEALRANAEQTGSVATDDRLLPLAARARELDRASAIVEKLEADLIELRTTEEHQACLLAEALRDLGADWTVQRVTTVDLSLPVFQRARGFAERTSTTRSQVEHALGALDQARRTDADRARWEALARDLQPAEATTAIPRLTVVTLVVVSALCLVAAGTSLAADAPVQAAGFAAVTCVAGWLSVVLHRRRAAVDRPRPDVPPAPEEPARYPDRPGPTGEQTLYQDHQDALAAQESLLAEWNLWRAQAGLPQTPSPQDCVELLDRVRSARTAAEAHRTTTGAIADVTGEIDRHRRAVAEVLALAGTDPTDPSATLASLLVAMADDADNRREIEQLEWARPTLERTRERASQKVARARTSLDELLACAGAHDAEGFRVVAAREQSRRRITDRLTQIDIELSARFGNDEAAEAARAELATGDLDAWEQGVGAIEEHRAEALTVYESAFEAYRAEAAAITEAENSADVAELSLQVEALRSELREAMDDWTVATLAHDAIDHTLRRFETERQPEVVRSAAECFRRITDGRYTNLVPEDDSLLVVDSDRNRLDSSKLSRGATEQLYLAMRLALARQYARSNALPLVLDDVLVNADPRRRVRLAAELHEAAADMQVLVFTCHPATAELFSHTPTCGGVRPGANIVEMTP